jgi:ribonuclease G
VSRILALSLAPGEIRGVLCEQGRPVELRLERDGEQSLVGAVFHARIAQILPALPGAFLELGSGAPSMMAFLPGNRLPGGQALVEGAAVLVQIVKDAIADKAPEATAAIELAGTLAVWSPARPGRAVSRRIAEPERSRLQTLLATLASPGDGVILRRHAAGADAETLALEIETLRRRHQEWRQAAIGAPHRLDAPKDPLARIIAALEPGQELERIVIDDRIAAARLRSLTGCAIELDSAADFTQRHGIDDAFEQALARRLALPGGGEIVIEQVLAGTAIDVNAAAAAATRRPADAVIRAVNREAATAIARQLRLRNIGGAIIIDFIAMAGRDDRREIEAALAETIAQDAVPVGLIGWTRLGHFELTRQRRSASIGERVLRPAAAKGVKTPVTVALEALRRLAAMPIGTLPIGRLELRAEPSVAAALAGPLAPALDQAIAQSGRRVAIIAEPGRDPETFDINPV